MKAIMTITTNVFAKVETKMFIIVLSLFRPDSANMMIIAFGKSHKKPSCR